MQVNDVVAIITGGASGLGAATTEYLTKLGAKVAAFDTNKQGIKDLTAKIDCLGIVCDVTSESSVQKAIKETKQKLGVPRVCINFAGILDGGRVVGRDGPMSLEHFKHVIDVDLVGTFNVMRLALAEMMQLDTIGDAQERGVVINISSIASTDGQIGQAAYSASKAGVAGMTLPVAREMASFGIRIACIAPGVFETPMMQNASDKIRAGLLTSAVFPNRFGLPEELAAFVRHIIENPMLNGDVWRLDGAMRMPPK